MNLQERVLGYAGLHDDGRAAVDFTVDASGTRLHSKIIPNEDLGRLLQKFKTNPEQVIRTCIENIDAIKATNDSSRVVRYFDAYTSLLTKLDARAFLRSDTTVFAGVPDYVPDGFSDMGSDKSLDMHHRNREKQYINKQAIFLKSKDFLRALVASKEPLLSRATIDSVALHVYNDMPYDSDGTAFKELGKAFNFGQSVSLDNYLDKKNPKAVCRNQALYAQVLLQSLGIKSRLLKCRVTFASGGGGAHVANLIKAKDAWYLLDVTNPVKRNGKYVISLTKLPDTDIDTNKKTYAWKVPTDTGTHLYTSRNNMFYRVKENY